MNTLTAAKVLFYMAASTFLLVATVTLYEIQLALPKYEKQVTGLLTDADRTTVIAAGTITNLEKESRQWKDQSLAQSQAATRAVAQLNSDLQNLGTLLSTSNSVLNKQDASLTNLEVQVGKSIENTNSSLQPILADLSTSANALAREAPPILKNLDDSSAQVVLVSENAADTTKSIAASAHDIQAFIHRETSPVTGTWNVIKGFLREFAAPMAQVATAAK